MKNTVNKLSLALLLTLALGCEKKESAQEETKKEEVAKQTDEKTEEKQEDTKASAESVVADQTKVVAEFADGTKITMGQVYDQLNLLPAEVKDKPFSKLYEALLRRLVDMKLLDKIATEMGLEKDSAILSQMDKNVETLIQRLYIEKEVKKLLTDSVLQKEFDDLKTKLPKEDEVHLKHILVRTKEEAKALIDELQKDPSKFSDVAKQRSIDKQTNNAGGDLGFVRKSAVNEAFGNLVFDAKNEGKILVEPIEIPQGGYSVMYVVEKRQAQPPKFEQVKAELSKALMPKYAAQVIEKLKKDSGVEVIGLDGKPVVDKTPEQLQAEAEKGVKKPEVDLSKVDQNMVVAKFKDGTTFKVKDILDALKTLPPQLQNAPVGEVFDPLLLRQVDMKLVLDAAKASDVEKEEANVKRIADVRQATLHKAVLAQKVGGIITDAMLKARYQEVLKALPKNQMEIRLRHIMVKTKEEAQALIKELKSGKSFDALVQDKSIDDKTKDRKGDLGYVRRDQLPPELGNAVFSAAKATMLPEPIKLGNDSWSVIRVEDKRMIEPPKFEEVKGELRNIVEGEKAVEVVDKLRSGAGIKAYDMNGNPLDLKTPAPQAPAAAQ